MLFSFIKYINPIWYFNVSPVRKRAFFPDYFSLPEEIKNLIAFDDSYSSKTASLNDAAYQAIQIGVVHHDKPLKNEGDAIGIEDEYRFIRKFYKPFWSYYILCLRILSFNNPFREIWALRKNRYLKKIPLLQKVVNHDKINSHKSELVDSNPLVSVIIPTLNRYVYLKDVLHDLENQQYKNIEVIVVDQSEPVEDEFYGQFSLNIVLVKQLEKALWQARNKAIKMSKGSFLLLFDDDSRVSSDWVYQHLMCLDYFQADISSGVSLSSVGSTIPDNYKFFRISDQLDTGNVMIKKEVFSSVGLFDLQFEKQRMGDGEFGLRCYLNGFKNISNPLAKRIHLKVGVGGLRQMGYWDGYRPKNIFAPRPVPSILYYFRKYYGDRAAILSLIKNIPPSIVPYKFKRSRTLLIIGSLFSIVLFPFILIQVLRSWKLSGIKLKQGPLIDAL